MSIAPVTHLFQALSPADIAQWKAALDRGAQAAELSPASQQAARISGPIHLTPRALDLAPGDAAERMAEPEPAPQVGGAASPGGL